MYAVPKQIILSVTFLVIAFDQVSKWLIRSSLDPGESRVIIPDFLEFSFAPNTGMAFSLFNDRPLLLTVLVTIINLFLLTYLFTAKSKLNIAFAFILGGALSNLIDRYLFGYVTDFINPVFVDFAVFNVADASIDIGVFFYLISYFKK